MTLCLIKRTADVIAYTERLISLADVLVGVVGGYHNDRDIVDNVRLVHFVERTSKPLITGMTMSRRMREISVFSFSIIEVQAEPSAASGNFKVVFQHFSEHHAVRFRNRQQ